MITGISCGWPLLSVVSTVVVVVAVVAATTAVVVVQICNELELLLPIESLELCDDRRADTIGFGFGLTTIPLPVAEHSSAKCFLLNVFTSILLEP